MLYITGAIKNMNDTIVGYRFYDSYTQVTTHVDTPTAVRFMQNMKVQNAQLRDNIVWITDGSEKSLPSVDEFTFKTDPSDNRLFVLAKLKTDGMVVGYRVVDRNGQQSILTYKQMLDSEARGFYNVKFLRSGQSLLISAIRGTMPVEETEAQGKGFSNKFLTDPKGFFTLINDGVVTLFGDRTASASVERNKELVSGTLMKTPDGYAYTQTITSQHSTSRVVVEYYMIIKEDKVAELIVKLVGRQVRLHIADFNASVLEDVTNGGTYLKSLVNMLLLYVRIIVGTTNWLTDTEKSVNELADLALNHIESSTKTNALATPATIASAKLKTFFADHAWLVMTDYVNKTNR